MSNCLLLSICGCIFNWVVCIAFKHQWSQLRAMFPNLFEYAFIRHCGSGGTWLCITGRDGQKLQKLYRFICRSFTPLTSRLVRSLSADERCVRWVGLRVVYCNLHCPRWSSYILLAHETQPLWKGSCLDIVALVSTSWMSSFLSAQIKTLYLSAKEINLISTFLLSI